MLSKIKTRGMKSLTKIQICLSNLLRFMQRRDIFSMWTTLYFILTFALVVPLMSDDLESSHEATPNPNRSLCPEVKPMTNFNIFAMLGDWFVAFYYSSSEEALTYDCMRVEFGLSQGNMDMRMKMTYRYANDPEDEAQTGNMTWQIPDPMRPEHWRHVEDHYRGIYNTDVIDTDYSSWLLLLHCSDPEPNKKFLSAFILSRKPSLHKQTVEYLKEKIGQYFIDLEYLFPVNQLRCLAQGEDLPEMTLENPVSSDAVNTDDLPQYSRPCKLTSLRQ